MKVSAQPRRSVIAEEFRNRTKGEALFNKLSYVGVGYFVVTGVSIFMTWLLSDHPRISPKFTEAAAKFTKKFRLPPSIADIGTLFLGGTIASVLPVKWLEDHKPQLVKKFDRSYYGDDQVDHNPALIEAHRELESLPKQTWMSVLGSRIVAFAATFSVFYLMGSNKSPFAKLTGESIDKRAIIFGRGIDKLLHKGNAQVVEKIEASAAENLRRIAGSAEGAQVGLKVMRDGPNADRIASRVWNYIGLDGFYTIITSGALFVFTRVFGGLFGKQAPEQTPAPQPALVHPEQFGIPADTLDANRSATATAVASATEAGDKPKPHVAQVAHNERLGSPIAQHITA